MKDSSLAIISLISFSIGIVFLIVLSSRVEIEKKSISSIDDNDLDKTIKINAEVKSVRKIKDLVFIRISQEKEIDVMLFDAEDFDEGMIQKGDMIEVTGKVSEYNGNKEIIGEDILVLS